MDARTAELKARLAQSRIGLINELRKTVSNVDYLPT